MAESGKSFTARVLVVEDDDVARIALAEQLADAGHEVTACETAEKALKAAGGDSFDVAVSDVRLPGMDGIEFLENLRAVSPGTLVIMLTGYGGVEDAVRAMKLGAADYLCKPVSADEILMRIERVLEFRQARNDRDRLQQEVETMFSYQSIIGHSDSMQEIFRLVEMVKDIDSTVLIEGETGTGKDRIARAIHFAGWRREYPFVPVNCMVLSRSLLESELFGHERGAFTGAYKAQPGRFEVAGQGSVLLDDVDDIPLELQGKLVNVLEQRKCERVGSTRSIELKCRVLCATKVDLASMVEEGRFRDDLYYRMNVVNIRIPPLRERRDDIPWLADHFLKVYSEKLGRQVRLITPQAMQIMHAWDWPGNVREIEHVIERAIALCTTDRITPDDLPDQMRGGGDGQALFKLNLPPEGKIDLQKLLHEVEGAAIKWASALSRGRQSAAADLLEIPRTTLQAKLQKHGQD